MEKPKLISSKKIFILPFIKDKNYTNLTLDQIIKILRDELPYLRKRYSVKSLRMFGSYAKNEQTPVSDLDLLVTFHETPGFFKYINLENHLSDKLGIKDYKYSSLGAEKDGLDKENSAYTKPRPKRKAYIEDGTNWLQYGNLLALPYRLVTRLSDLGYIFRGEVIWYKKNAMPEGRCRRPHRKHEPIYLFAKDEQHQFRKKPPVESIWLCSNSFTWLPKTLRKNGQRPCKTGH